MNMQRFAHIRFLDSFQLRHELYGGWESYIQTNNPFILITDIRFMTQAKSVLQK